VIQSIPRRAIPAALLVLASLAGFVAAPSGEAAAADLVVNNLTGSDAQNDRGLVAGAATFGPYRTIARALAAAQPGDRLILTDTGEPYRECVSLTGRRHSGGPTAPFQLIGNGATLDGSVYARPAAWQAVGQGVYEYEATPPGYGLLILRDDARRPLSRRDAGTGPFRLEPMQWTRLGGRFFFRPEPNRAPSQYDLEVTEQATGLSLYDVRNVEIRDLTIRGFRFDGIHAHDRASEIRLINVTCLENGRSGVSVSGACRVQLEASQLTRNGIAQLRTAGQSHLVLRDVQADAGDAVGLLKQGGQVEGELLPLEPAQ
jgi:hypothetical protein